MALSLSRIQVADKAHNLAIPDGSEDMVNVGDIELMIDPAAMELCARIIKTGEIERLRDPAIIVSVTNGVGITPANVYAETIAPGRGGIITFARSDDSTPTRQPLKFSPNYDFLRRPKQGGETDIYFTIRGNAGAPEIHVFSAAGTACTGTATISACRSYTYENLPSELEGEYIDVLAEMVRSRLAGEKQKNTTLAEDQTTNE